MSAASTGRVWLRARAFLILPVLLLASCHRNAKPERNPFAGVSQPDIVLLTIDTLRADALGYAGNTISATPNLDRLAREGLVLTEAHSQNVVTLPSHTNILTGLYPYQTGVRDNSGFRLSSSIPTLATWLKGAGYATAAFVSAFPVDARFGLSRGFDIYDEDFPQGAHSYDFVEPRRPSAETISRARTWLLATRDKPSFVWIHLYDCHSPYLSGPPFSEQLQRNPYLAAVSTVDANLAGLLDDLRSRSRPILLVMTGDHGESLGEHGERTHGLFAYEPTLHIPLLVWSPGHVAPRREDALVRHIDIAPTILEAAHLPVPTNLPGKSLFDIASDSPRVSYFESLTSMYQRGWAPLRGVMDNRAKYIDLPIPEVYEWRTDRSERNNAISSDENAVRRLQAFLPRNDKFTAAGRESPETVARLRNLGYLSSPSPLHSEYGPKDDPKNLVSVDADLQKVISLYAEHQIGAAIALAKDIVARYPGLRSAYEDLAFLQGQMGADGDAVQTFLAAERQGLLTDDLKSRLGLLYSEMGRFREALAILEPMAQSTDPDILNALGVARATAGQMGKAMEAFQAAIHIDPHNAVAFQNIGIAYLHAGQRARAIEAFEAAFRVNEQLPRAWNAYGVALEESGRSPEALRAWEKAIALDPEQFEALYNLGTIAAKQNENELARRALTRYLATAPAALFREDRETAARLLRTLPPSR